MIKFENIDVWGFKHAIRGMRNSYKSHNKSDSTESTIGENDLALMRKLIKAGSSHRKFLRQISVSVDITAPLYWWKEFDTYKVGTTANSESSMHSICDKEYELNDFSHEHITSDRISALQITVNNLNEDREAYLRTNNKELWWNIIQLLPISYNQKRTVTLNYENVLNIITQRENHRLDEWHAFIAAAQELPYLNELIGEK